MSFVKANPINLFMNWYIGLGIFLCSAIALSVKSGYSYGPAALFLASVSLIVYRPKILITPSDWKFAALLCGYFIVSVLYNIGFKLPSRSYDGITRFLLAAAVYFLLIFYPPKPIYFWSGLVIGTLGAFIFAFYQRFYMIPVMDRAGGYINPIQFGDISFLMASLLLCGFVWAKSSLKMPLFSYIFLIASAAGFLASFLSISRGGWLAMPCVLFVFFKTLNVSTKKILAVVAFIGTLCSVVVVLLPDSSTFKQRLVETRNDVSSLFNNSSQESVSFNSRLQMWDIGFEAFLEQPITGWGNITNIKKQYPEQWAPLEAVDNFNHLHNEYIDTLAKKGGLGFGMLMLIYFVPLVTFMGYMRSRNKELVAFSACGVVLITCTMIFGLTQTFMAHISGVTCFTFFLVIIAAYVRNIYSDIKKC